MLGFYTYNHKHTEDEYIQSNYLKITFTCNSKFFELSLGVFVIKLSIVNGKKWTLYSHCSLKVTLQVSHGAELEHRS